MLSADSVYYIIYSHNGIKASEIARKLGVRTSEVNSVIYSKLSSKCFQDDNYFWFAKGDAPKTTPKVIEKKERDNSYQNTPKQKVSSDIMEMNCPKCGTWVNAQNRKVENTLYLPLDDDQMVLFA